ncbi:phosphatidylinositol N-acetylglucosaminyltransferase subunit H [Callorhinchus milii]|uniref:Phosphatidylinositol N-acetylglucosaminyltransferase subunit H n=1 Tax=Callorhinchus milii TaxID=7868 RepID=V9KJ02_CALMI|nr:phosphatidylinositol N-acetylglucosaminyltransferase subunit H [Callorhinchus milii]|eukprot:gi/632977280/ref/XP_007905259.1/ PREDICTED: phosphatidylinositol N-acetylglucosaminyltransferase subunit H [Callorhinchus milii]
MAAGGFRDVSGGSISFEQRLHSSLCGEFTVTSPKLSLRSVLAATSGVWLAAYFAFYYTQNSSVLSATIILTLVGMTVYLHLFKIDHETLLIIGSVGVQLTTLYASGRENVTFIEINKVKDIVINEAIYMQKVIYYLCILLKDPSNPRGVLEVVPVFQSAKPRLDCLTAVYRRCQQILLEAKIRYEQFETNGNL